MKSDDDLRLALTTCSSREEAVRIAQALVQERLAACVNILDGVESTYRWQGSVVSEKELILLIKTRSSLLDRVRERISQEHSYEVFELVVVVPEAIDEPYLAWWREGTQG
jgi:periplasmic divalent cation tolerance protein